MARLRKGLREDKSTRKGKRELRTPAPRVEVYTSPLEHHSGEEGELKYSPEASILLLLQQMDQLNAPIKRQEMRFECIFFIYLLVHLFLQNYNIYHLVGSPQDQNQFSS